MRHKRIIRSDKRGTVLEEVTETFTHRLDIGVGTLRADPENNHWAIGGTSWFGQPPMNWDAKLAVPEKYTRTYEMEVDYS